MGFPPGAQFVRQRLVPVAAAPRFMAAPPPIQLAQASRPQPMNPVGALTSHPLDMNHHQRTIVNQQQGVPQQQQGHHGQQTKSSQNYEPLSEEDFYKWQMQLKNR